MTHPTPWFAYCTNVHAGADLESALANLERFSVPVAQKIASIRLESDSPTFPTKPSPGSPFHHPLGVGWWLSDDAATSALADLTTVRHRIDRLGLQIRTLNGFPQFNFHEPIVKQRVYLPSWCEPTRREYTLRLIKVLASLLPPDGTGSISTLPLGWGNPRWTEEHFTIAAQNLSLVAMALDQHLQTTGQEIVLALEPEPGCTLGDASSLRKFFLRYLFKGKGAERNRKFLTVCHDICHSAVMFEDQGRELQAYRDVGIRVGKVQVSSALHIHWDALSPSERTVAWEQLASFVEERYLHQTVTRSGPAGSVRFHEDLGPLMATTDREKLEGSWRVHFHVPIHLSELDLLQTSQSEILRCVRLMKDLPHEWFTGHWEVETYAWSVLPKHLRASDLASGIASELLWFHHLFASETSSES